MLSLNLSNFFAVNVARQAGMVNKAQERLSSGQRIITSADDPAGLSIADGLRAMKEGAQQAQRNINDAINVVKLGEDGLQGVFPILNRLRELVLQAANSSQSDQDRSVIQQEMDEIKNMIPDAFYAAHSARVDLDSVDNADRILHFQVGPNAGDLVEVDFNPLRDLLHQTVLDSFGYEELYNSKYGEMLVAAFGSPAPLPSDPVPPVGPFAGYPPGTTFADAFPKKLVVSPGTDTGYAQSLDLIDNFRNGLTGQAAYLGSITNRLEHTLESVSGFEIDMTASESQIRDADFAREMTAMTKAQVIQQTATAMMGQANQRPFQVLELLKGG